MCTDGYVAPELLAEDAASYDLSVDVWSAAVVTYEVVSLVRFCSSTAVIDELTCIGGRLGDVQNNSAIDREVGPWQRDIAEPWQRLIALGLKRRA